MAAASAALLAYAAILTVLGPRVMRGSWTARSPRLGLACWLTLLTSTTASIVLAGAAMTHMWAEQHGGASINQDGAAILSLWTLVSGTEQ